MDADSSKDLLKSISKGNRNAFKSIYHLYSDGLFLFARKQLGSKTEAEEVLQEVFLELWEKRSSLRIHTSLKSYLYTMVYHACIKRGERNRKLRTVSIDQAPEMPTYHVEEALLYSEFLLKIQKALDLLPPQCRKIFEMSRFQGKKYRQIAEELKLSVKTVENQMGKALKILKKNLVEIGADKIVIISFLLKILFFS